MRTNVHGSVRGTMDPIHSTFTVSLCDVTAFSLQVGSNPTIRAVVIGDSLADRMASALRVTIASN
jgi:hypothetical protein